MRLKFALIGVVLLITLAGCSQVMQPQQEEQMNVENLSTDEIGFVDVEYTFNATLSSDSEINSQEVALYVDGEEVQTKEVSVESGETTTVTFSHTFEETGEYDVSVLDESKTVTVVTIEDGIRRSTGGDVQNYKTLFTSELFLVTEDETTNRMKLAGRGTYDLEQNEMQSGRTLDITNDGELFTNVTLNEWYSDGTTYQLKTNDSTGETETFTRVQEFSERQPVDRKHLSTLLRGQEYEREGETFVYTLEAENEEEKKELFQAVRVTNLYYESLGEYSEYEESAENTTLTVRVNAETGRLVDVTLESDIVNDNGTEGTLNVGYTFISYNDDEVEIDELPSEFE